MTLALEPSAEPSIRKNSYNWIVYEETGIIENSVILLSVYLFLLLISTLVFRYMVFIKSRHWKRMIEGSVMMV